MDWQRIVIGCDHAGFPYKEAISEWLTARGIAVIDEGTYSADSVDYPDFVHPAMSQIVAGTADAGILLCGSGNGVAMTANKYPDVRAALCWLPELAALAREHNKANVLCLPVRYIEQTIALQIVEAFLTTAFAGGRHARRVDKMNPATVD